MIIEQARAQPEPKQGERMDLGNYLQKGLQVLQLDVKTIRDVSQDENALLPALLFFALAGLANGAGQFDFRVMIFGPILATLLSFVLVGLLSVLSRLFGSSASFLELYRPLGLAAPLHWVQAVPIIGPFLGFFAHRGSRIAVEGAEVARTLYQQQARSERLRDANESVVDRAIAVRVQRAHHVADDFRALAKPRVRVDPLLPHREQDAPLHRFQPIAHIGERTRGDDRKRVVQITGLRGLVELDDRDVDAISGCASHPTDVVKRKSPLAGKLPLAGRAFLGFGSR